MNGNILLAGGIGFVSGIACRSFFIFDWHVLAFFATLALLLYSVSRVYRTHVYVLLSVFLVCMTLGSGRVLLAERDVPPVLRTDVSEVVTYEGVVVADPDIREVSQRVVVRVEKGEEEIRLLTVAPRYPVLSYGDTVRVTGELSYPEPFETLGGRVFDYPAYLRKDGILLMLPQAEVEKIETSVPRSMYVLRALFAARKAFASGVARAIPEPAASLAMGMLVGGKQGLGKELLEAFTLSGLLPIVVLSGYNVMIVAEAVLRMLKRTPQRFATSVAALTIILFVLSAGAGASAFRAGSMACIALFARATGRTYDALRILFVVFVFMVAWNPYLLLHDPGFQFSFAATLGIIIGSPTVSGWLSWIRSSLVREVSATTIAAQLFVLPLLLYETGMLSLVAVPANILALPLVPLAMLLSFMAGIVGIIIPAAAPLAGLPAYLVLSLVIAIATTSAELPLAAHTISQFPFFVVILLYALLVALLLKYKKTTPHPVGAG
jgi:competence protein ComEC